MFHHLMSFVFQSRNIKYYLILGAVLLILSVYFFFIIMSYIWPILVLVLLAGSAYLYFFDRKNRIK